MIPKRSETTVAPGNPRKEKRATDQENLDLLPFLFRLEGSPVRPLQHLSARWSSPTPLVPSGVIVSGCPTNSTSTSRTSAFTATTYSASDVVTKRPVGASLALDSFFDREQVSLETRPKPGVDFIFPPQESPLSRIEWKGDRHGQAVIECRSRPWWLR